MGITGDTYFSNKAVSNSDLSKLKNELYPREMPDPTNAYKFGSLLDAMITEPHRVNFFKRSCDEDFFSKAEFEVAERMKAAFYKDELCNQLVGISEFQRIYLKQVTMNYRGVEFSLPMRCKFDLYMPTLGYGADIKTTTAETQAQFDAAIRYFDYPRQRAVYMTLAESDYDVLIGISKKNFKIFKTFIKRGDALYREGYEDYINLAYRWWLINGEAA